MNKPYRLCPKCEKEGIPPSGEVVCCQHCFAMVNMDTGEVLSKDLGIQKPFLYRFVQNLSGNDLEVLEDLIQERKKFSSV